MSDFCIEAQRLSVLRGELTVLRDINLRIRAGEFIAIVGKSGAGKSTFLHALAGHIPYSGDLRIPKQIGMVFQKHVVFPWMTVKQNVSFGLSAMSVQTKEEKVAHSLRIAGIEEKATSYPSELSGGQAQRIAIAREFGRKPDVLLMDEPFGALDVITREAMQRWLLDVWQQERMTIIMVTHSIEEALVLADRILVLRDGKFTHEYGEFRPPLRGTTRLSYQFLNMRQVIADSLITADSATTPQGTAQ